LATLVEELRRVELFAPLPEDCVERFAAAGTMRELRAGETTRADGDPADAVFVILDGKVRITQRHGDHERTLVTYGANTLFGEIPLLMGSPTYWATGRVIADARILEVPAPAFWELLATCQPAATAVMKEMASRISALESVGQSRHRLVALGTLAAGLAHELNNPASAARRATAGMEDAVEELAEHSARLGGLLGGTQCDLLEEIREGAAAAAPTGAMERMAREDECLEWLSAAGLSEEMAAGLADCGVTPADLERIRTLVPPAALADAVGWLEVRLRASSLARTAADSAARVAAVVDALKGYTRLGEAPITQMDLNLALQSTLAVLAPRLAGVTVEQRLDPALPQVRGYGSELNQVFTALLENASDALEGRPGRVRVATCRDGDEACVEVEDDGPGIAPEVRERIFDPFFTTREVGRGMGLGLSTAFRIVTEHGGTLRFRSQPGCTVFEVRLPFDPPLAEA
jgi:signal transduction histidine kinase